MRNFKRFLTLALAVVMVASMFAFGTSAAQFTDVDENNAYLAKSVNLLNYIGVAKGTSETTFGIDELVTREQMAAFIYRLMKKGNSVEGGANASRFTDLEDPTFFFMISWADTQGIIKGTSATTFEPKGSITLQDAYTMIVRALGYEKEESLPYPFGYIEVAEDKGVALDEGLDSKVTYTDALTRGDVAILLYNAFFAETGVAETKQVERKIGDDENATWVLETKTNYPTLAEKVYDVLEVEYKAIATPKYAFDTETKTTSDLGYEAILFKKADEDDSDTKDAPSEFYADVKDLALDGSADDYIMGHFNMFVTLDDDNDIDEILYAESLMTKKSVSDIKLETLTSNAKYSYYGNDSDNAKRLSGKAIIDGKEAYFYNAPYSYSKPTYATGSNDKNKYVARNADNLKLITRKTIGDLDDHEYTFKVNDLFKAVPLRTNDNGDEIIDEYCTEHSNTLVETLKQVYTGGLYEADVYDVDGDGLYDYINYMPYSFYFVDDNDSYTFNVEGYTSDKKTAYINEAVIEGEKIKDEDFVLGYFDQEANYIKAAKVIEAVKATVTDIKKSTNTITLSTGDKVSAIDAWKLVANYNEDAKLKDKGYVVNDVDWAQLSDKNDLQSLVSAAAYDSDSIKFYVYDGAVLFQEGVDSNITFDKNLLIVTPDADDNDSYIQDGAFSATTGRTTYVHVWVDGAEKWVPVDTDADVWPNIKDDIDVYLNKVATYTVDSDGLYTIKLLGNAYDDKKMDADSYIGLNTDESKLDDEDDDTIQYLYEGNGTEKLTKQVGKRFKSVGGDFTRTFVVDKNSIILIRAEYDDGDDHVVDFARYTADTLTETITNELTNVQIVVSNNPDSTRENLVLYFAQANSELSLDSQTATKSDRIVKMMEPKMNADKKYYYEYTLFNPYTGTEETVAGNNTGYGKNDEAKASYGDIVEITTSGNVDDKKSNAVKGNVKDGENQYWIIDYDADSKVIEVAVLPKNLGEAQAIVDENESVKTIRLNVEDTAVSKVGNQGNNGTDMIRWGSISKAAVADLGSDSNSLKAVNSYAKKETDALKTVYAKYIKAYIDIDWEDKNNHEAINDDTKCNGDANYIVIIANNGEPLYRCVYNNKLIED